MKIAIVLSTNQAEINWNALRLANFALMQGDIVSIFLLGEGVEYAKNTSTKFDIKSQMEHFLKEDGKVVACGTCMNIRHKDSTETCPMGSINDLYSLIKESDKLLTF